MTEKRFRHNGSMIFDDRKALNTIDVVELLNMLHEEITHLKEVIRRYDYSMDMKNSEINNLHLNYLKLEKENEQLKKE